jgi:hypothetical protein
MTFPDDLRDAVTWDGANAVLSMFTATRDSTVPLPAVWPHGEWYRPGIGRPTRSTFVRPP